MLPPNLPIQNSDCYKSYGEFCKHVATFKLPQKWKISIGNNVHCWNKDNIHEIPEIEVFIDNLLNFTIRVFAWCLAIDQEITKKKKKSVKNITV